MTSNKFKLVCCIDYSFCSRFVQFPIGMTTFEVEFPIRVVPRKLSVMRSSDIQMYGLIVDNFLCFLQVFCLKCGTMTLKNMLHLLYLQIHVSKTKNSIG